jgi:PucR C-terminal helix-turn-helix domain
MFSIVDAYICRSAEGSVRMLEDRLQLMVEQLAERLGRSVIVDDAALRPLAVSAQLGRLDPSRIEAVLQRHTGARIRALISEHKVHRARRPVRIPANDELGTLGRVVVPIRHGGQHLGFLWLIDDPVLGPDQLDVAIDAAADAGALLAARAAQDSEEVETARRLLAELLRPDPRARSRAAERMSELGIPADGGPYLLAVVRTRSGTPPDAAELPRVAGDVRRRVGNRVVVCATPRPNELVALTALSRRNVLSRALVAVAGHLAVGTRSQLDGLEEVGEGYGDARFAAEVAATVARFDGRADWAELGPYAAFQHMSRDRAALERLCPGVSALWADGNDMYAATARCFLDHGGNAQRTAAALHIHRTTLYWRLANIERLLGLTLADGDDRLMLHLSLKLAELVPEIVAERAVRHLSE